MELQFNKKEKYFFIETFGCQMNENDSERIAGTLRHLNYATTDTMDRADIVIFNTCSIRLKAEQKVYSALGRLKGLKAGNPDLIIGVGGCVAQQEGEKLLKRVPHLDVVFGTHNIHRLPEFIREVETKRARVAATEFFDAIEEDSFDFAYTESQSKGSSRRVKTFVAVMRGCDNFCSYCIVPYVRGREISRKSSEILKEIKNLIAAGIKEVTLVGQNVNSYGGKGGDISFPELLKAVCRLEGIERVRFVTSHPKDISDELIHYFGEEEKLCRHLHLPVQSGSNKVLERMCRGYRREDYLKKVFKLKSLYPDMAITTDIIVGFPGETEADFLETMRMIKDLEFDSIFSFKFSPRPETKATSFDDQIPESLKEERLRIVHEEQREITFRRNLRLRGKTVPVLIEGKSRISEGSLFENAGQFTGRTPCNKVVNVRNTASSFAEDYTGKILAVKIDKVFENSLLGSFAVDNAA